MASGGRTRTRHRGDRSQSARGAVQPPTSRVEAWPVERTVKGPYHERGERQGPFSVVGLRYPPTATAGERLALGLLCAVAAVFLALQWYGPAVAAFVALAITLVLAQL